MVGLLDTGRDGAEGRPLRTTRKALIRGSEAPVASFILLFARNERSREPAYSTRPPSARPYRRPPGSICLELNPQVPQRRWTPNRVSAVSNPARLIVFAGLPGTGKSTLARMVAECFGAVWLRVDTLEASLLKAGIPQSFETGLAAYIAARDLAAVQLELGRDVVIDAVNGVEPARQMWSDLSKEFHAVRHVIELVCPDEGEHRRRVESRLPPTPPLPGPTWDEVVHREYQTWNEPVLSLDGMKPPKENLGRILDYVLVVESHPPL